MTRLAIELLAAGAVGFLCLALGHKFSARISFWRRKLALRRLASRHGTCTLADEPGAWYGMAKPILWAHAGGGALHTYGNSKEAIEYSLDHGLRVIEIDVDLTSDGVPVLTHRFRPDNQIAFDHRPDLKEFLSTPVNGRFTPLTLERLFALFGDRDVFFAIDSWGIARSGLRFDLIDYIDRMADERLHQKIIFLANSIDEGVTIAQTRKFASVHCGLPEDIDTDGGIWQLPDLVRIYAGANIHSVTLMDREITDRTEQVVGELESHGIHVSICGVETVKRCKKWRKLGVGVFNTNKLYPALLS